MLSSLLFLSLYSLIAPPAVSSLSAPQSQMLYQWARDKAPESEQRYSPAQVLLVKANPYANYFVRFSAIALPEFQISCSFGFYWGAPLIGQQKQKTEYLCQAAKNEEIYEGELSFRLPPCPADACINPAIGVGNLLIIPKDWQQLIDLAPELDYDIGFEDRLPKPIRPVLPPKFGNDLNL